MTPAEFRCRLSELWPHPAPEWFPGKLGAQARALDLIGRDKFRILEGMLANAYFEQTFFGAASPLRKTSGQIALAGAGREDGRGVTHAYLRPERGMEADGEVADALAASGLAVYQARFSPELDRFLAGAAPHVKGAPLPDASSCAWDHLLESAGYWNDAHDAEERARQAARLKSEMDGYVGPWRAKDDKVRQADALRDLLAFHGERFVEDAVLPRALLNFVIGPFFRHSVWDVDAVVRHEGRILAVVEAKQKWPGVIQGMPCGYFGMNEAEAARMLEMVRAFGVPVTMVVLAHPHWVKVNTPSHLLRSKAALKNSLWLGARLDEHRLRRLLAGPRITGDEDRSKVVPVRLSEFYVLGRAGFREPHVDATAAANLVRLAKGEDWLMEQPTLAMLHSLKLKYEKHDEKVPMALVGRE